MRRLKRIFVFPTTPQTQLAQQALTGETAAKLQRQAFVRPERLTEVVVEAENALEASTKLMNTMELYMENPVARAILMRPVVEDSSLILRRLEVVVRTCVEGGEAMALVKRIHTVESLMTQKLLE